MDGAHFRAFFTLPRVLKYCIYIVPAGEGAAGGEFGTIHAGQGDQGVAWSETLVSRGHYKLRTYKYMRFQ